VTGGVTIVNFQSDYALENIAADLEIAMETDARLEKARDRKAELRAIVQEHDIVFGVFKGNEYANGYGRHMIKGAGTIQLIGQVPEDRRNVSRTYTIILCRDLMEAMDINEMFGDERPKI
jgi:hypothetical protein